MQGLKPWSWRTLPFINKKFGFSIHINLYRLYKQKLHNEEAELFWTAFLPTCWSSWISATTNQLILASYLYLFNYSQGYLAFLLKSYLILLMSYLVNLFCMVHATWHIIYMLCTLFIALLILFAVTKQFHDH